MSPSLSFYAIEKLSALFVVAPILYFCTPAQVLQILIVAGQGHFFIAYRYQYKAGKITTKFLILYLTLLTSLLAIFLYTEAFGWLVVIAGTQFLMHFLQDEVFLFGGTHSIFTSLEVLAACVLYFGVLHDQIFFSSISGYTNLLALLLIFGYVLLALFRKYRPIIPSRPVLVSLILLFSIELFSISVPAEILLGSIILFHYMEWYVHFWLKLKNNKPALFSYLRWVVGINLFVVTLYLCYVYAQDTFMLLQYLFLPFYFYIWTLMHTLTSIRAADFKNGLHWPK